MAEQTYFIESELKSSLGNEYSASSICIHLNTRSTQNEIVELGSFFYVFSFLFDVIMLAEILMKDVFGLPMYKSYFWSRATGRGGGVSLMVRENAPAIC